MTADSSFRKARKALTDLLTDDVRNDEFYAITACLNATTALYEAYLRGVGTETSVSNPEASK